jgi:alpha-D-ribose 1-methylphosphonate 5-triphosphate diphosphatase
MLIRNARVVTRDEEFTGVVWIENDVIRDISRGTTSARESEDWEGDYLLPGLIELHTDNLEKHLAPRPGVYWNTDAAFVIHDAQVAAAGITTVFDALAIGSRAHNGPRERGIQTRCSASPNANCCAPTTSCICAAKSRPATSSKCSTSCAGIRCCGSRR